MSSGQFPLPGQQSTILPIDSTKGIHKMPTRSGGLPQGMRSPDLSIFRWLAHLQKAAFTGFTLRTTDCNFSSLRSTSKQRKININSKSKNESYRRGFSFYDGNGLPARREVPGHLRSVHLQVHPKASVRTCFRLLWHIVSCTYITLHARLHLSCMQGWMKFV